MSMVIRASGFMRRAYTGNALFQDESYRNNSSNHDVMSADRKALSRALKQLETLNFESRDEDDTESIFHAVTSYLDIYNNAVGSAMDSESSDIRRTGKDMKALMKEYGSSLEAIGIQLKGDGTVKVDKAELKKATTTQVSKIFGNSDYTGEMKKLMRKLRGQVNREIPKQQQPPERVKSDSLLPETVGRNLNLYG